jgi:hypothetical protein
MQLNRCLVSQLAIPEEQPCKSYSSTKTILKHYLVAEEEGDFLLSFQSPSPWQPVHRKPALSNVANIVAIHKTRKTTNAERKRQRVGHNTE